MKDPYEVLGINITDSDDTIRKKYLALVRQFSPDRAPEKFAEIRSAYESLRDPVIRVERLFAGNKEGTTLDRLIGQAYQKLRDASLPVAVVIALAEEG